MNIRVVRSKSAMPSPFSGRSLLLLSGLVWTLGVQALSAQDFAPEGGESLLSGARIGDQTCPQISISETGGYAVCQDNGIDGKGLGIAARRLNQNLSTSFGAFRVNQITNGWQENPQVTLLKNGGAVIAWQGGKQGNQDIYLRMLATNGTFISPNDVQVNTYTKSTQTSPTMTRITNGNVALAWSSFGQDGSLQGVYGRVLNRNG